MAQPFLHHRQAFLVATAMRVEHPFGRQPRLRETGREQVAAREHPQNGSVAARLLAGKPRSNAGNEQDGGGLVAGIGTGAGRFVQGGNGQASAFEAAVHCLDPERQAFPLRPSGSGFDRPHLRAQRGKAAGPIGSLDGLAKGGRVMGKSRHGIRDSFVPFMFLLYSSGVNQLPERLSPVFSS